ncbi:MAG: CaiB/BaiF CoA transferase family protein [Cyclobacteriaceae bacterium]
MNTIDNHSIFSNLRILEFSSVLAGPAVGMFFAELGAQVIKLENIHAGGDITRNWKMSAEGPSTAASAYYHSVNWNKESRFVDLCDEQVKSDIYELVKQTDIVIANFRYGSAEKLGMDYNTFKKINQGILYGSISAYGKRDPRPGFDVSMQAETGWAYMNGEEAGPPIKMPVALIDILAAHQLKEGLLIGLMKRLKTGKGSEVHVSLFAASIATLANQASNWLNLGVLPERKGSKHPNIAPYGDILNTKDGIQMMLTTGTQGQFVQLCDTLNLSWMITDPKYITNASRLKHRSVLIEKLQAQASLFTLQELEARDPKIKSLMSPIQNLQQVFENPEAKSMVLRQTEADGSESKRVATVAFKIEE